MASCRHVACVTVAHIRLRQSSVNWWGKLAGGAFGFMLGGPIGALIGAALGHGVDRGLSALEAESIATEGFDQRNRAQAAFFTATFSVMGHISKADGRVTPDEIGLATHLMDHLNLGDDQRAAARHLFNQGKSKDFDLGAVLEQFRRECHHSRNLRRMFLEVQVQAAYADDRLHVNEMNILRRICGELGLSQEEFEHVERLVKAGVELESAAPATVALADDYALLGLTPSATEPDLKRAYRRLMSQHHPDRLLARGLPDEMVKIATEKTQAIKAAYERIKKARRESAGGN